MSGIEYSDDVLMQLFGLERNAVSPSSELEVVVQAEHDIGHGEALIVPSGCALISRWSDYGPIITERLREEFRIPVRNSGHLDGGVALARLIRTTPNSKRYWHVAPWFMKWFAHSSMVPIELRSTMATMQIASEVGQHQRLYRGEDQLYPRVCSTLSRTWGTSNPEILEELRQDATAKARIRRPGINDDAAQSSIQQLGGLSNFVDFTRLIWIALYFATGNSDGGTGRIWELQGIDDHDGIRIRRPDDLPDDTAIGRIRAQMAYFVESNDGIVPRARLIEVARVEGRHKAALRTLLEQIGITRATLFPDLVDLIGSGQSTISLKGWLLINLDALKSRQYNHVLDNAERLMELHPDDVFSQRAARYIAGLAIALTGEPRAGFHQLSVSKSIFAPHERPLQVMDYNMRRVRACMASGDVSRLHSKIDFAYWEGLDSASRDLGVYHVRIAGNEPRNAKLTNGK